MKKALILIVLSLPFFSFSQKLDTTVVFLKSPKYGPYRLYRGIGVIFPKDKVEWNSDDLAERYTPSKNDIYEAELIFYKQYNLWHMENKRIYYFEIVPKVRKKYIKWNRQYLGYVNKDGDKIIVMQLLNFRHKLKANKVFKDWKQNYLMDINRFNKRNVELYYINITKVLLYQK